MKKQLLILFITLYLVGCSTINTHSNVRIEAKPYTHIAVLFDAKYTPEKEPVTLREKGAARDITFFLRFAKNHFTKSLIKAAEEKQYKVTFFDAKDTKKYAGTGTPAFLIVKYSNFLVSQRYKYNQYKGGYLKGGKLQAALFNLDKKKVWDASLNVKKIHAVGSYNQAHVDAVAKEIVESLYSDKVIE